MPAHPQQQRGSRSVVTGARRVPHDHPLAWTWRLFTTRITPSTCCARVAARSFMASPSTVPLRLTVPPLVSTLIPVNVDVPCSAASFAFTAAVMDASSTFCPTLFPVPESHPASTGVKSATISTERRRKRITLTSLRYGFLQGNL